MELNVLVLKGDEGKVPLSAVIERTTIPTLSDDEREGGDCLVRLATQANRRGFYSANTPPTVSLPLRLCNA